MKLTFSGGAQSPAHLEKMSPVYKFFSELMKITEFAEDLTAS